MSSRETIDRAMREIDPPQLTLDRFHRRLERKRRVQQGATVVFALALFGIVAFFAGHAVFLDRNTPADQGPSPSAVPALHGAGDIAIPTGELIDPTSGRSTGSLPFPAVTDMSWSPDGASLAYAAPDGVFVLDTASGSTRRILPCGSDRHACTVAWSPGGGAIAVAHDEVLVLVDANGGEATGVRTFARGELVRDPSWSPDGDRLAFTLSGGPDSTRDLYVVNRDGSDMTGIVKGSPNAIGVWAPSWSPDGSRIAYIDSGEWGKGWKLNVTIVDPDGTNRTVLMDAGWCYCLGFVPGLDWSPDGTRLALVVPPLGDELGKRGGLYVVNADGTDLKLVAGGVSGQPAWRPA
jgi:dipeptidyl aminopeptidase/acylaminoacyl peptidase